MKTMLKFTKKTTLDQSIKGMELWHNFIGAHFTYNSKLSLVDFDIFGEDKNENDVGIEQWHQSVNQMTFKDVKVTGYKWGALIKDSLNGEIDKKGEIIATNNGVNYKYWKAADMKTERK